MNTVLTPPMLTVRRIIQAPVRDVFDAWLSAEALAVWMRPGAIPRTTARVDARVGGTYEIVMHAADGPIRHIGIYEVIDRPRRLVFTWASPATHHSDSRVSVEFHARDGGTEILLTQERLPDETAVREHDQGWTQALELLAAHFAA
ncbi:MAG: SRPBCC family protein [Panacagrimonas sp.]